MGDVPSSMWYFCTLLLSLLLPYVNFSGNDACPKAVLERRLENQNQPFWGDFTFFEELFANPYFLLWIFCTYREALTSIWPSTLWIKSFGFFGCFALESPTHKTGQMSFGPRSSIEISSYLYRRPYTSAAQYVISKCSMNDCSQRSCVSWAMLNRIGSIQLT